MSRQLTSLLLTLLCCSCSTVLDPRYAMRENRETDSTSAFQLTERRKVEEINLGELLRHYNPDPSSRTDNHCNSSDINTAASCFNQAAQKVGDAPARQARNALQERMLAASTQRCNAFKGNLQRDYARTNFGLGTLATIAGTVGALATTGASQIWAGASAIFSGTRAEYNQDYLANLAVYVVVDGIDQRQRETYKHIQTLGQNKPYADYPVEAAIKDAFYFHGLCSVTTGFQVAQSAIKEIDNPGLSTSIRTLARLKIAQHINTLDGKDLDTLLHDSRKLATFDPITAGSNLGDTQSTSSGPQQHSAALEKTQQQLSQGLTRLQALAKTHDKQSARLPSLGLDPLPTTAPANYPSACFAKLGKLNGQELSARQQATNTQDKAEQANARLQAEEFNQQANAINQRSQLLVSTYQQDVRTKLAELDDKLKASKDDASKDSDFQTAIKTLPKLNDTLLKPLQTMCE